MKKFLVFLCVMISFVSLSACQLASVPKQGLMEGEKLAIYVESYTYYEKLVLADIGEGRMEIRIDVTSPIVVNNFSKTIVAEVEERFSAALKERGVIIQPEAPIRVRISMARGEKGNLVFFSELAEFFRKEESRFCEAIVVGGYPDPAGGLFERDGYRNLSSIKNTAGKIAEALSNATISVLRQKGELRR